MKVKKYRLSFRYFAPLGVARGEAFAMATSKDDADFHGEMLAAAYGWVFDGSSPSR